MLKVVKIGGNIVDDAAKLEQFITLFAAMKGRKILVHGGGKVATAISSALGIETKMVDGRRVTDSDTLRVVTMVYAGDINTGIVNKLNAAGCRAVGLNGSDGGFVVSKRREGEVDWGFVGDPVSVNTSLANTLMDSGYTIVVAPITTDGKGQLLNTNADTVAQAIAVAMAQGEGVELVYCFEKRGVLRDIDDEMSVIPTIDEALFAELRALGVVAQGMLPKIENAFEALHRGVNSVVICSAESMDEGTVIKI